jgi:hypothetical protein
MSLIIAYFPCAIAVTTSSQSRPSPDALEVNPQPLASRAISPIRRSEGFMESPSRFPAET